MEFFEKNYQICLSFQWGILTLQTQTGSAGFFDDSNGFLFFKNDSQEI